METYLHQTLIPLYNINDYNNDHEVVNEYEKNETGPMRASDIQ
jgi:hypothetical protein